MTINVVTKGKEGEREVVRMLNAELERLIASEGYGEEIINVLRGVAQRNQNQSAVGGGDINLFNLSIEVKRQETSSVEQWWRQACTSAQRNADKPVLIYRQNRKAWHVVMDGYVPLPSGAQLGARVEIHIEEFRSWFRAWVQDKIRSGELSRV